MASKEKADGGGTKSKRSRREGSTASSASNAGGGGGGGGGTNSQTGTSAAAASSTTTTTIEPSASSSTTTGTTSSTPSRHNQSTTRAISPARLSRLQERAELQNLNDRLAAYIERNRQLEKENSQLKVQVQKTTESRELHTVKRMYEQELGDTRQSLDVLAREKAQTELLLTRAQEDLKKAENKLNKKVSEVATLEDRIASLESQLDDLRGKIAQQNNDRKRLEGANRALADENTLLEDRLDAIKKQLEEETIVRVDLENRNQSLNEELAFKQQLYQKELDEVRHTKTEMTEIYQENVRQQYEAKLARELDALREENEERVNFYRQELEDKYEEQLSDASEQLLAAREEASQAVKQVKQLNTTLLSVQSELADVKRAKTGLEDKVEDLKKLLEQEREWTRSADKRKDRELKELSSRLETMMDEHRDLLDDKLKLDAELAVYRKLLEGEETRLNISPKVSSSPYLDTSVIGEGGGGGGGGASSTYTPRSYVSRGNKRKRICLQEEQNLYDLNVTAQAKGDVEISDHDVDGKFVKLHNKGDKDIHLGGWHLLRVAGDLETRFKFHRSIVIKPDHTVTIWSSDANAFHSPPDELVMKSQTWFTADTMTTQLFNAQNEEMASRKTVKTISSFLQRSGYVDDDENDANNDRQCVIM